MFLIRGIFIISRTLLGLYWLFPLNDTKYKEIAMIWPIWVFVSKGSAHASPLHDPALKIEAGASSEEPGALLVRSPWLMYLKLVYWRGTKTKATLWSFLFLETPFRKWKETISGGCPPGPPLEGKSFLSG